MEKQNPSTVTDAVFGVSMLIFLGLLQGLVFSHLWAWYLVPLGLPAIGYVHAFMIVLMVRLTSYRPHFQKPKDRKASDRFGQVVAVWLFAWGLGYLLSSSL